MSTDSSPLGQILSIKNLSDGTTRVKIDNGIVNTITITCHAEQLQDLLATDMKELRDHMMTRKPGHFRRK
jgi:hypothetical protein